MMLHQWLIISRRFEKTTYLVQSRFSIKYDIGMPGMKINHKEMLCEDICCVYLCRNGTRREIF